MQKAQAYEKVPIYRKARDIFRDSHVVGAAMTQAYKHSLGITIRTVALELTEAVFLAYEERDDLAAKLKHIEEINRLTHRALIAYRIADEANEVGRDQYATQVENAVYVFRRCQEWHAETIADMTAERQAA